MTTTLSQDLIKLRKLKQASTKANKAADDAKAEFKSWQRHCFTRMEAEETTSQKARGTLFSKVCKTYATIQDRSAFIAWAAENEPDLVRQVESKADVHSLVRRCLDDGEPLPPGLGHYNEEYISQKGTA